MEKTILAGFLLLFFISNSLFGQDIYNTTNGEIIFGWSNARYNTPSDGGRIINGNEVGKVQDDVRFTIWFHFSTNWHYDFSNRFGLYSGLSNRNIGFITNEMSTAIDNNTGSTYIVKWKRRSYALGVPLALKFGNMEKGFYGFVGGQVEWLYHYKEKEFLTTGKRKYSEWFSERTLMFLPSVFVGITFPHGLSVKFTYALNDFMNKSYVDAAGNKPYKDFDSRIMYISFFNTIRWEKNTYEKKEKRNTKMAFM